MNKHNIDDLKKNWKKSEIKYAPVSNESFKTIYKTRIKKQNNEIMKYFWSSFVFQLIVYGLFFHFVIRYGTSNEVLLLSAMGIIIYIPYTVILMNRYKRMAILKVNSVLKMYPPICTIT